MADTTVQERIIKTIIIIRNDTEANFEANSSLMLRKGEMAISISEDVTKPSKIKVGDGIHTWGELPYINGKNSGSNESGINFTPDGKALQLTSEDVLTLIGLDTANPGESFRISEDGTTIEWFTGASVDEVTANKTLIDQLNQSLIDNYYTKTEIDSKVGSVFHYKGHVANLSALNAIVTPSEGDAYVVDDLSALYVYSIDNGWEEFPLGVDLSQYVTIEDFTPIKDTVESLPETIIAKVEASTSETGAIEVRTNTASKGEDGRYTSNGDHTILRVEEVIANGKAGLMSGADKAKLDMLVETAETGGQANIIENIKVGGVSLPVDSDKGVNIPIAGETLGVVKNYTGDEEDKPVNVVNIEEDGTMTVPEIHIDTLVQDENNDFIIAGGGAAN